MTFTNRQTAFYLSIALLSIIFVNSCQPSSTSARDELASSLKGANVEGFYFANHENESQEVSSLTNSAVSNLIKFDDATNNIVLRYTRVKDKAKGTTNTYKTEIVKTGNALDFLITELETGDSVFKKNLPAPTATDNFPTYDTFEACIDDFNCTKRSALQCEANRTCEPQFAAIICCRKDGQCLSIHFVFKPNSRKCLLRDLIPDLEGIAVNR